MARRYWVRINKETHGPFSLVELRNHPSIDQQALVCPDGAHGGDDWMRLEDVPEYAEPELNAAPEPEPERRKCPHCARSNIVTARFCYHCGARLKTGAAAPEPPRSRTQRFKSAAGGLLRAPHPGSLITALMALSMVVGLYALLNEKKPPPPPPPPKWEPRPTRPMIPSSLDIAALDASPTHAFRDVYRTMRTPREGHIWFVVDLKVRNTHTTKKWGFTRSWLELEDAGGKTYERDTAGYSRNDTIRDADLKPGREISGTLVYQIPKGAVPRRLMYDDKLGDPFEVPLPRFGSSSRSEPKPKAEKWAGRSGVAINLAASFICPGGSMMGRTLAQGMARIDAETKKSARELVGKLPQDWKPQSDEDLPKLMALSYLESGSSMGKVEYSAKQGSGPVYVVNALIGAGGKGLTGEPVAPTKVSFHVDIRTRKVGPNRDAPADVTTDTHSVCFKE